MSTPLRERPDAPLGTLIFRAGLLPAETIESALEEGVKTGKRLGEILTERGLISEVDLARLLAGQKGLEFVTLREQIVDPSAAALFTEEQARLFRALPYAFDGELPVVAIADPTDDVLIRNIREALGREDARFVVSAPQRARRDRRRRLLAAAPPRPRGLARARRLPPPEAEAVPRSSTRTATARRRRARSRAAPPRGRRAGRARAPAFQVEAPRSELRRRYESLDPPEPRCRCPRARAGYRRRPRATRGPARARHAPGARAVATSSPSLPSVEPEPPFAPERTMPPEVVPEAYDRPPPSSRPSLARAFPAEPASAPQMPSPWAPSRRVPPTSIRARRGRAGAVPGARSPPSAGPVPARSAAARASTSEPQPRA